MRNGKSRRKVDRTSTTVPLAYVRVFGDKSPPNLCRAENLSSAWPVAKLPFSQ